MKTAKSPKWENWGNEYTDMHALVYENKTAIIKRSKKVQDNWGIKVSKKMIDDSELTRLRSFPCEEINTLKEAQEIAEKWLNEL